MKGFKVSSYHAQSRLEINVDVAEWPVGKESLNIRLFSLLE